MKGRHGRLSAMSLPVSCLVGWSGSTTNLFWRTGRPPFRRSKQDVSTEGNGRRLVLKKSRGNPKGSRLRRTPLAWAGKDRPEAFPLPCAGGGATPPTKYCLRRQNFFIPFPPKTWPTSGHATHPFSHNKEAWPTSGHGAQPFFHNKDMADQKPGHP